MDIVDIIVKKRDGGKLFREEINCFVKGVVDGTTSDYQISALLMAIYLNGMDITETTALTKAMIESGERLHLPLSSPKFDKHSTGGVGDKVSLILAPLLASSGIAVPMLSGRSLGHTGGTLNKLNSIPHIRVYLSKEEIEKGVRDTGMVIAGQTERIAPADRKIYLLRDRTGTVESIPLIISSILSKKLSEDIDGLVLDIKVGKGAFMKTKKSAKLLAKTMIEVGRKMNVQIGAVLTNMNTPLGTAVGTGVEIYETVRILKGEEYPFSLMKVTLELFKAVAELAGIRGGDPMEKIREGSAYKKFRDFVEYQGGDVSYIDSPQKLLENCVPEYVISDKEGFIMGMDTERIGKVTVETENISSGIIFHKRTGDRVKEGELLASIFWKSENEVPLKNTILSCYKIETEPPQNEEMIIERVKS